MKKKEIDALRVRLLCALWEPNFEDTSAGRLAWPTDGNPPAWARRKNVYEAWEFFDSCPDPTTDLNDAFEALRRWGYSNCVVDRVFNGRGKHVGHYVTIGNDRTDIAAEGKTEALAISVALGKALKAAA